MTHKAAAAVCQGDLHQAQTLYDSAFALDCRPFLTDLNNALFAAAGLETPDRERIGFYLRSIQRAGVCVHQYYQKRTRIVPYLSFASEANCKQVANPTAASCIEKAMAEDQRLRNYTSEKLAASQAEAFKIDSVNYFLADSILRLADNANIPLDNYIGEDRAYNLFSLLLHNVDWGRSNKRFLDSLAKKGIIDARYLAAQYDYYLSVRKAPLKGKEWMMSTDCAPFALYGTNCLLLTFYGVLIKIPPATCTISINRKRAALYLQDMLEEAKIRTFAFYNYRNGFTYPGINIAALTADDLRQLEAQLAHKYSLIRYRDEKDFDYYREQ